MKYVEKIADTYNFMNHESNFENVRAGPGLGPRGGVPGFGSRGGVPGFGSQGSSPGVSGPEVRVPGSQRWRVLEVWVREMNLYKTDSHKFWIHLTSIFETCASLNRSR